MEASLWAKKHKMHAIAISVKMPYTSNSWKNCLFEFTQTVYIKLI